MRDLAAALLCLAVLPQTAAATTIDVTQSYDLTVTQGATSDVTVQTPVIGDVVSLTGADLDGYEVSWIDEDSFFVSGTSSSTISDLSFLFEGLEFLDGGLAAQIVNVVFDPIETDLSQFVGFTSIIGPAVSFTATSITISITTIPSAAEAEQIFIDDGIAEIGELVNVAADGVRFYFNVTARAEAAPPAPVPLPASALLLGAALAGLGALGRRRSTKA